MALMPGLVLLSLCAIISLSAAAPLEPTTQAANKPVILGPQPPHFVAYSDKSLFGIPGSSDLEVRVRSVRLHMSQLTFLRDRASTP